MPVWHIFMAALLALASVAQPSPEELLRRSDVGAFAPSAFRARLVLTGQSRGDTHELEIWRSGTSHTLVRMLDAKDLGKYLLRIDNQMWLLTPGAKQPVRLSPSYRLYGGATLDEVLSVRLAQVYDIESSSRLEDPAGDVVAFELRGKTDDLLFPRVRYVVRAATARPVTATYRVRSGRDATAIEFVQWSTGELLYARRVIVRDLLRKGAATEVEVAELDERPVPAALFSLTDPSARRELGPSRP